ncbi:MAG: hypothetical protein J0M10_03820 [Chitinophagales bacterium]|nr:hypothetical protein [Chitinophagales bacterium]
MIIEKSLHSRIEQEVIRLEPGRIIFPADFLEMGSPEAIYMALSRLNDQKELIRLGNGIYVKPKKDPLLGTVLPSLEDIANAIAVKERVIIRPTGSYALNKLGLSTQVPMKVVFLTNGSRRRIQVGRGVISFKPTTPKNLAAKNEIVFLAIQSLVELGKQGITEKVKLKLTEKLMQVSPVIIREDARNAPQFVCKILLDIANKVAHHD